MKLDSQAIHAGQRWFRVEQFCRRYDVHPNTLLLWRSEGKVRAAKIGGTVFIDDLSFSSTLTEASAALAAHENQD